MRAGLIPGPLFVFGSYICAMAKLLLAEVFYSIQGEGPTTGIPSIFIRLGGCNLLCGRNPDDTPAEGARWECDTIDVWRNGKRANTAALIDRLHTEFNYFQRTSPVHLVITGGEPLLQQEALAELLEGIHLKQAELNPSQHPYIEVETNGTVIPTVSLLVSRWNVSPKLSNSGQPRAKRIVPEVLQRFVYNLKVYGSSSAHDVIFKFVVSSPSDWDEIRNDFIEPYKIPLSNIVLMPGASTIEHLHLIAPTVVEICKAHRVRYSSRAQVEIWNQTTGV